MPFAQEHTSSYYAATVNEVTDYPRLKEDLRVDVCIIGGGFTGVSAALALAERSYNVCVLEANRIGWGASGRNGGQMIGGVSGENQLLKKDPGLADLMWEMGWRGHDIIRERVERYDIDCDLKHGYVDVAIKPRHLRDFEKAEAKLTRRNYPYEHGMMSRTDYAACQLCFRFEFAQVARLYRHIDVGHVRAVDIVMLDPLTMMSWPRPPFPTSGSPPSPGCFFSKLVFAADAADHLTAVPAGRTPGRYGSLRAHRHCGTLGKREGGRHTRKATANNADIDVQSSSNADNQ